MLYVLYFDGLDVNPYRLFRVIICNLCHFVKI
jgi:hypothetical protein